MGVNKVVYGTTTIIDISDSTVAANKMLKGTVAYGANGDKVTGNIETKTSSNLSASGKTVTVPAGYYASNATKDVSTVTRATTSISTTADTTNAKLTLSASNNQGTGYVTGSNQTASKVITLTASGATVTATDNSATPVKVSKSVATATRASTTLSSAKSNNTLVFTAGNNQGTGYVTGSNSTATKTVSLSTSGATVTASDGTNSISQSVTTATQATPSISVSSAGVITASATQTAGYVSAGTKSATKQLTTQGAKTVTPTTSEQTAVASGVYTTGAIKVAAIPTVTRAQTSIDISLDADVPNLINVVARNNQATGYVVADVKKNVASTELYLEAEGNKAILRDSNGAIAEVTVSGGENVKVVSALFNLDEVPSGGRVDVTLTRLVNGEIVRTSYTFNSGDIEDIDNVVANSIIWFGCSGCCLMDDTGCFERVIYSSSSYGEAYLYIADDYNNFNFWD